jgi:HD-GYP domain-containing protein (c-di-GMP phosphodiesterase class II)
MSLTTSIQFAPLQTMISPLEVVYDGFPGLVLLVDSSGVILDYKAGYDYHLYPYFDKTLHKSVQNFLPQRISRHVLRTIDSLKQTGKSTSINFSLIIETKAEWFEARFSPIDNRQIIIVIKNITEEKQKEIQFQRQHKWLKALQEIDISIASGSDLALSLSVLLKHITVDLEVDAADILVLKKDEANLDFFAGYGFNESNPEDHYAQLGVGYAGVAALEQRTIHVENLSSYHDDFLHSPIISQEGFVDYYAIPLVAKSNVKGVLEIYHRSSIQRDSEWLNFLETLGRQAAIAIDNAMLFDDLQHSQIELEQAYNATIVGWSHALDLRDRETEDHTRRVTDITLKLASFMEVPQDKLVHIQRGAILHDIGKMGIPDHILHKRGALTEKEWEVMRQHPQYAFEMLAPISYLEPALDIPYFHHEKWDGTGYPRGLRGTQIPLAARIFAVADVYDALTSERPYRSAWSRKKAQEYIFAKANEHFDPDVVDCFREMIGGVKL